MRPGDTGARRDDFRTGLVRWRPTMLASGCVYPRGDRNPAGVHAEHRACASRAAPSSIAKATPAQRPRARRAGLPGRAAPATSARARADARGRQEWQAGFMTPRTRTRPSRHSKREDRQRPAAKVTPPVRPPDARNSARARAANRAHSAAPDHAHAPPSAAGVRWETTPQTPSQRPQVVDRAAVWGPQLPLGFGGERRLVHEFGGAVVVEHRERIGDQEADECRRCAQRDPQRRAPAGVRLAPPGSARRPPRRTAPLRSRPCTCSRRQGPSRRPPADSRACGPQVVHRRSPTATA